MNHQELIVAKCLANRKLAESVRANTNCCWLQMDFPSQGSYRVCSHGCVEDFRMIAFRDALILAAMIFLPGCSGCEKQVPPQSSAQNSVAQDTDAQQAAQADQPPSAEQHAAATKLATGIQSGPNRETDSADQGEQGSDESAATANAKSSGQPSKTGVTTNSKQSRTRSGQVSTARDAVTQARGLRERSQQAQWKKNFGGAFELASQAWETVQAFPSDTECRSLAQELAAELDKLGGQANAQHTGELKGDRKPLIER